MDHNKNKSSDRLVPISKKDLSKKCWGFKATIRHGQCDPAGIAYTPKLFDLLNVTVEEWYLSCLGINYYEIIGDRRTGLGYVKKLLPQLMFFKLKKLKKLDVKTIPSL